MNFLIIGCGSIGTRRARILAELGHSLFLLDQDAARADALADAVGGRVWNGVGNIETDAVFICTPPTAHIEHALAAAEHGIPFFIEKPLAANLDAATLNDLRALATAMQEFGAFAVMGQSYRFLPSLRDFRRHILDHSLINAIIVGGQHIADWQPHADYRDSMYVSANNGGIVRASLAHSLDLCNWLFGEIYALTALIADTRALGIEANCPDTATVLVRTERGAQVALQNDFWKRPRQSEIWATCAVADGTNTFHWALDLAEVETMYFEETLHFVRCVEKGYQGQPDIWQGVKILEWMDAATRASNTGTWQTINQVWKQVSGRK